MFNFFQLWACGFIRNARIPVKWKFLSFFIRYYNGRRSAKSHLNILFMPWDFIHRCLNYKANLPPTMLKKCKRRDTINDWKRIEYRQTRISNDKHFNFIDNNNSNTTIFSYSAHISIHTRFIHRRHPFSFNANTIFLSLSLPSVDAIKPNIMHMYISIHANLYYSVE